MRVWPGSERLQGLWGWNLPSLPRAPIRLTSELVIGSVQVSGIGQTLLATLAPHGPRRPPPVASRLGRGRGRRVATIGRSHGAPWRRGSLPGLGGRESPGWGSESGDLAEV